MAGKKRDFASRRPAHPPIALSPATSTKMVCASSSSSSLSQPSPSSLSLPLSHLSLHAALTTCSFFHPFLKFNFYLILPSPLTPARGPLLCKTTSNTFFVFKIPTLRVSVRSCTPLPPSRVAVAGSPTSFARRQTLISTRGQYFTTLFTLKK